jgi:uncharacterized phage-associated protein
MKSVVRTSFPFDGQKATEVCARFVALSGKRINILKLVKLVYLLDRESIARRGVPVVGGVYLSMRNGPVTSEILDLVNAGRLWNCDTNWEYYISDRQNHEIELVRDPGSEHLSVFEMQLIEELWHLHEHEDQWALADWCHANCGEWLPLDKGREHISLAHLAEEVGCEAEEVLENAAEQNFLKRVFG